MYPIFGPISLDGISFKQLAREIHLPAILPRVLIGDSEESLPSPRCAGWKGRGGQSPRAKHWERKLVLAKPGQKWRTFIAYKCYL